VLLELAVPPDGWLVGVELWAGEPLAAVIPLLVPPDPVGVELVEPLEGGVDPLAVVVVLEGLVALAAIEGSTVPTLLLEADFGADAPDASVELVPAGDCFSVAVFFASVFGFVFALGAAGVAGAGAGTVVTLAGWTTAAAIASVAVATVG
jgi:hypothetical protein